MSSDRVRVVLPLLCVIGACEIETIGIARTEPLVALHGVLSATAETQVVMLERTRHGGVPSFELGEVGVTAPVAETGAIVELTMPSGLTLVAPEDLSFPENRGSGAGLYRFTLPGDALERGGRYRLRVRTTAGEELIAETSVPEGIAAGSAQQRVFDRARDTLVIEWPASPGARSYFVRIETPYGPRSFFTDSTHVRLAGELRNVDARSLPRIFIPGFPQAVTVSAADSNFYDWFRTHNNRLSGTGLISRVQGGVGVFGSLVRVRFVDLHVVSPQPEPTAGTFRFDGTQFDRSVTPYLGFELYVESRAARGDQGDALSGRYDRRPFLGMRGCITCGLLGNVRNGRVELAFLRDWSARDTADVLDGEISGDTIYGVYRNQGGPVRFVRQR